MFWGLIMEPNKRYTQTVERPFHVSMATLDISTSDDEPVQVMLCYEGRNYLLCNLSKKQTCQATLDLNFQEGTKISFTSNGSGHVHLTGYLVPEDDMDDLDEMDEQEDEEEDEEEVPQLVGKQLKRKATDKNDDRKMKKWKAALADCLAENGQDDSSDSDNVIEEEGDEEEEEDDEEEGGMELEFEDDDDDDDDNDDDEDEEVDDEEEGEEEEDDDDDDDEEEEEEKVEEVKPKGKQNQQQQQKNQKQQKDAKDKAVVVNGKDTNQQKKNKKEQQQQQAKATQEVKPEVKQQQAPKKQVLGGGIVIEELKVGTGAPAAKGKFISVYYIGKLKNGKKFDSTQSGKGFKFRLGGGEVIKGWDIGLIGMKVGGKRRVTVPPAMGYGKKGSPPVIPGNSVLVFDVELKEVH